MNALHARPDLDRTVDALEWTPLRLKELVQGLGEADLRRRRSPETFSILENIVHLRDIDIEGYALRLERILKEEHPWLPDLDGAALARARRYNEMPLEPALEALAASRRGSIARLREMSEEDLSRTAELEGVGRVALPRLIEMWRAHDAEHVAEVETLVSDLARERP